MPHITIARAGLDKQTLAQRMGGGMERAREEGMQLRRPRRRDSAIFRVSYESSPRRARVPRRTKATGMSGRDGCRCKLYRTPRQSVTQAVSATCQ
jgi:hypothetical protein